MSKLCAVVSRHELNDRQKDSLVMLREIEQFIQVDSVFKTAKDAWETTLMVCRRRPDLIVAILPDPIMVEFLELAKPIEVVEAEMYRYKEGWVWAGNWNSIVGYRRVRLPLDAHVYTG